MTDVDGPATPQPRHRRRLPPLAGRARAGLAVLTVAAIAMTALTITAWSSPCAFRGDQTCGTPPPLAQWHQQSVTASAQPAVSISTNSVPPPTAAPTSPPPTSRPAAKTRPTTTPPPASTPPPGRNVAQGRPVAESGHADVYRGGNVTDGSATTYWEGVNGRFPASVTVDLGVAVPVSRVVLRLPAVPGWNRRVQTLSISGSTDGTGYATLAGSAGRTFDEATGNTVTVAVTRGTRRYLRVTITANDGWDAGQLSEIEAYGR